MKKLLKTSWYVVTALAVASVLAVMVSIALGDPSPVVSGDRRGVTAASVTNLANPFYVLKAGNSSGSQGVDGAFRIQTTNSFGLVQTNFNTGTGAIPFYISDGNGNVAQLRNLSPNRWYWDYTGDALIRWNGGSSDLYLHGAICDIDAASLYLQSVGKGFGLKEGANCRMGTFAFQSGVSTVLSNTTVTASTRVFITPITANAQAGIISVTNQVGVGVQFIPAITQTNTYNYLMFEAQ